VSKSIVPFDYEAIKDWKPPASFWIPFLLAQKWNEAFGSLEKNTKTYLILLKNT
jgi:hypothetical protein